MCDPKRRQDSVFVNCSDVCRVPVLLKVLVFRVLAKLLMIKLTKPRRRQRAEKCGGLAIRDTDTQPASGPGDQAATCALCRNNQSASKRLVKVFVDALVTILSCSLDLVFCLSVMHCSLGRLSDRISLALELHQRRQEEEDARDEIKMEWQLAAMIIDRCASDEYPLPPFKAC